MRESREIREYGCQMKEGNVENVYAESPNVDNLELDIKGQWHIISY